MVCQCQKVRESQVEDLANENAAMWQVQSGAGDGNESTASGASANNVALFNDSGKVIGTLSVSYISEITIDARRAVPENEAVNADNNEIQDMGIDGLDIVLQGVTGKVDDDNVASLVNKLSKWFQDGNTTTGFTKGRYGLRLDNLPQFNVVPTSALGFHMRDFKIIHQGEDVDRVRFTIRLALGGDIPTAI